MQSVIRFLLPFLLVAAHLPFFLRFFNGLRHSHIPSPIYFASAGIFLYYDLGFLLQSCGWTYYSLFFPQLADLPFATYTMLFLVILAAPYLLALGFRLICDDRPLHTPTTKVYLASTLEPFFKAVFIPIAILFLANGIFTVWGAASLAETKHAWMGSLGNLYIIFLVPLFALAFFVRTTASNGPTGALYTAIFLCSAIGSTLFLGQRTMTLLPILVVALFKFRVTVSRAILLAALLLGISAGTLWYYKGTAVSSGDDPVAKMTFVLNNDFSRTNVLGRALQESPLVGSEIMPVAGSGYLYTLLFYIPRTIAPEKGYSTAAYFTSSANGDDLEFMSWGVGIGFIEEIILNFGVISIVPGILLYGLSLGILTKLSRKWKAASVGVHLFPVWMCGYGSSALVLYFGSMIIMAILLEEFFAYTPRTNKESGDDVFFLLQGKIPNRFHTKEAQ